MEFSPGAFGQVSFHGICPRYYTPETNGRTSQPVVNCTKTPGFRYIMNKMVVKEESIKNSVALQRKTTGRVKYRFGKSRSQANTALDAINIGDTVSLLI